MYTVCIRRISKPIRVQVCYCPSYPPAALVENPNHSRRAEMCVAGECGPQEKFVSTDRRRDSTTTSPSTQNRARTQSWDSLPQKSDCIITLPNRSRSNRYIGERKSARTREIHFGPTIPRASVTNTSSTSDGHLARL